MPDTIQRLTGVPPAPAIVRHLGWSASTHTRTLPDPIAAADARARARAQDAAWARINRERNPNRWGH